MAIFAVPKTGELLADKYRVESVLGSGGMAVVLAARHVELGTRVAIKLLHANDQSDEDIERFKREARIAAQLQSEHICRITDVGRLANGAPYVVMEHLQGRDLDGELAARGPLPVDEAVALVIQACEGLAEAHAKGIVHRDLKPKNLFLTRRADGRRVLKVVDFGLAKAGGRVREGSLTRATDVFGSPHYMAPEQMRASRGVDARADVWALGVTLYELLTRRMPFESESLPEVCGLVLHGPPTPITQYRHNLPPELVQIVERCLEKDVGARFESVHALAAALEPFTASPAGEASLRIARIFEAGGEVRSTGDQVPLARPTTLLGTSTKLAGSFDSLTEVRPRKRNARVVMIGAGAATVLIALAVVSGSTLGRKHAVESGELIVPAQASAPANGQASKVPSNEALPTSPAASERSASPAVLAVSAQNPTARDAGHVMLPPDTAAASPVTPPPAAKPRETKPKAPRNDPGARP